MQTCLSCDSPRKASCVSSLLIKHKHLLGESVEGKGTLLYWWECKLTQPPLWKAVWRFLRNPKVRSHNPIPGRISGKGEKSNWKRYMHPNVHRNTIYSIQDMKQPNCPSTDDCGICLCVCVYIHTHTMEYYSVIKWMKQCHSQQHGWIWILSY